MKALIVVSIMLLALSFGVALADKMYKINVTEKITINTTDNLTTPNASENVTMPTKIILVKNTTNITENMPNEKESEISPNKTPVKISASTIVAMMNKTMRSSEKGA